MPGALRSPIEAILGPLEEHGGLHARLNMARSQKKGPFVDEKLYRKAMAAKERGDAMPVRTWARRCMIVPEFVGIRFEIHNGNKFLPLFVTEDMVGHYLGEFSPSRSFRGHAGRKGR